VLRLLKISFLVAMLLGTTSCALTPILVPLAALEIARSRPTPSPVVPYVRPAPPVRLLAPAPQDPYPMARFEATASGPTLYGPNRAIIDARPVQHTGITVAPAAPESSVDASQDMSTDAPSTTALQETHSSSAQGNVPAPSVAAVDHVNAKSATSRGTPTHRPDGAPPAFMFFAAVGLVVCIVYVLQRMRGGTFLEALAAEEGPRIARPRGFQADGPDIVIEHNGRVQRFRTNSQGQILQVDE
jgi:hypothetical protein